MADLDTVIQRIQEALDATPTDHPDRAGRLDNLGAGYRDRYQRTGTIADLNTAIQRSQEALDTTPADHPDRAGRLNNLGVGYRARYQRTGIIADLDTAIQRFQEALDTTLADHLDRAGRLDNLGVGYRDRYQRTGTIADLDTAIQRFQEAVDTTPADHPDRAGRLDNLGVGYGDRYQRTGTIADLDTAIQRSQEALDTTPADHPDRAGRLANLGAGYGDRYQRTGTIADLNTAIQRFQEAVDTTPADHPDRAGRLDNLGAGYRDRYQRTGIIADLNTAIQRSQEAVDTTPADHPDRAGRLDNLGAGYRDRYQRTGTIADLNTAIQRFQKAVDMTLANHPDRAGRLHNLGVGYEDRYQRTGTVADLDTAIQRFQEALDATLADHPNRAGRLDNLGGGYRDRYQRTGTVADLDTAIQRSQKAVDTTPADHPDRARRLDNLGAGYGDRYQRTGTIADLDTAIQRSQEALDTTPADHPNRADRLANLGAKYQDRYQRTGTIADLDTAIQRSQEAVDTTPADYPDRARRLANLGAEYQNRYQRTGTIADLDTAIQRSQEALDTTPADHPDRAGPLHNLGIGYGDRYQRTGTMADLDTAIERYQQALDQSSSPVRDRLKAGSKLLIVYAKSGNWPQAYQAASETVSLVPLLTPRYLEISDKQYLLTQVLDLSSTVAAIAMNAARPASDAVQALELGRGVITGSINELRADIFDLQQKHPHLAEEYVSLRDLLDTPVLTTQREVDQRYTTGQKLERVLHQIRRLPDFDRFLQAPSEDELKTAAEYGPLVIVNVSHYRCDALIIKKTQIQALPLPHLHASDIQDRAIGALGKPEILEWLWKAIAQPVLNALEFTQTPSDGRWPHVWWISTGLLAKFPIHAAGRHSQSSSDAVLDRVISSYSSSVKTIIHSRRHRSRPITACKSEKVVLLAMQKTPKKWDLRFATREINDLERLCSSMNIQVIKPLLYKAEVLSALSSCKIFHFAGHGSTHDSDPVESHLLLEDWETEPLTVASLFEINLQNQRPFLAYLSACGTGRIKPNKFLDESLHLISGYQLAGFQHVIGTLWDVNDESCVEIATTTYKWILDHGMSDESVSEGLHHASRCLRRKWIEENSEREASRSDKGLLEIRDDQIAVQRSDSSQGKARDPRDGELCDDTKSNPLHWVPYVHFGV